MNRVILSGGLTRDPEVRYTQSGKAVASFSLAVNRGYKKAENSQYPQSDYFNIIAWEKLAEFCGKYLAKGTRILVEGRLQSRSYEAQDGSKRNVVEVVADSIEFAGAKPQDRSSASSNNGDDMIDSGHSKTSDDFDIPF